MHAKNVLMFASMFVFLFASFSGVLAVPGVPHQFYGSATVNGNPASDGLIVSSRIQGVEVAATTTLGGSYGLSPNIFYIEDPDNTRQGKTVEFYIDGVKAGEFTFSNGESTKLDLSITKSVPSPPPAAPTGGGGGSGGGGGTTKTTTPKGNEQCTESWECTDWLDCFNGNQERVCTDKNSCGTVINKPAEKRTCEIVTLTQEECSEDWSCTSWSDCLGEIQRRACNDLNNCGTTNNKPEETKSCILDQPISTTGLITGNIMYYLPYIIAVVVIVALAIAGVAYRKKGKTGNKIQAKTENAEPEGWQGFEKS